MTHISVIIPVYNAANTLARCLDSVLSQTISPFEIITIDDGSTDSSLCILHEYASRYPFIHVISQTNKGVSIARNRGIEASQCEWILFVDADDYLEATTLEILAVGTHAEMSLAGLTIHTSEKTYNQNLFRDNKNREKDCYLTPIEEALLTLSYYTLCGPVCKLFRADIVKRYSIQFPADLHFGEDTIFVYTYLKYVKQIMVHNVHLYHCDKGNKQSLTATTNSSIYYNSFNKIYPIMKASYQQHGVSSDFADYIYLDALQTATHFSYKDHQLSPSERISIYKQMFANEKFNSIQDQCSPIFIALGTIRAWHLCDLYLIIKNAIV